MESAFYSAENMTVVATDLSAVTSMARMFQGASLANPDTSGWNTITVTDMNRMFMFATVANPDTSNWNISLVTNMVLMFSGVTLPSGSYDTLLIGFSNQSVQSNVMFDGGGSQVCSIEGMNAKNSLISSDGWVISDGGLCGEIDSVFNSGFESLWFWSANFMYQPILIKTA
ncbi:MAG: DUF285 domain-containing protein [Xanthomonadales bacterium]|nr:DUF285 domain-containing protein [Xanthomonadales bacterium]